jgi:hypothetical protein
MVDAHAAHQLATHCQREPNFPQLWESKIGLPLTVGALQCEKGGNGRLDVWVD